jgi:hypothetical protein
VKLLWKSPEAGARPIVRLASAEEVTGQYFHLDTEQPLAPVAADAALAERLRTQALELTGLKPLAMSPKQQRGEATVEKVLSTALDLYAAKGSSGLTMTALIAETRISSGSL